VTSATGRVVSRAGAHVPGALHVRNVNEQKKVHRPAGVVSDVRTDSFTVIRSDLRPAAWVDEYLAWLMD